MRTVISMTPKVVLLLRTYLNPSQSFPANPLRPVGGADILRRLCWDLAMPLTCTVEPRSQRSRTEIM